MTTLARFMGAPQRSMALDAERLFLLTKPIHRAFCVIGVIVCCASTLLAPAFWYIGLLVSLFFVIILTTRLLVVDLPDQQQALTLFGRGWLFATSLGCSSFVAGNVTLQLCTGVPDAAVATLAALTGLVPVYLNLTGVHSVHQVLNNVSIAMAFWLSPQWSAMPHESSTFIMWSGLLCGDLVGTFARQKLVSALVAKDARIAEPRESPSSPPSDIPESAERSRRFCMHPFSLAFDDYDCEMEYAIATAFEPASLAHDKVVHILMGVAALGGMATAQSAWSIMPVLHCVGLVVIRHRHKPMAAEWDAHAAATTAAAAATAELSHHRLGWFLMCGVSALSMRVWLLPKSCPVQTVSGLFCVGSFMALVVVHQWVAGMQRLHRSVSKFAVLLAVAVAHVEPSSETPSNTGMLSDIGLCACFLAFGELVGYSFDHVRRISYVEQCERTVERKQAELRIARAEAAQKMLQEQKRKQQAQRSADSRLNHMIKGRCGTARSTIAAFLALHEQAFGSPLTAEMIELREMLKRTIDSLGEAVEWCHRRQIFVQLEQGNYTSHRAACDVHGLLNAAIGSDGVVNVSADMASVSVDESVLRIVLEEALSNARKYRRVSTSIILSAFMEPVGTGSHPGTDADKSAQTTDAGADASGSDTGALFHVTVRNSNQANAVVLDADQLVRVMQPGFKTHMASAMSDGLGLDSILKACRGAGGFAWLSMDAKYTELHATLPVGPTSAHVQYSPAQGGDSADSHSFTATSGASPVSSSAISSSATPISSSTTPIRSSTTTATGSSPTAQQGGASEATARPVCIGLDDDELARRMLSVLFSNYLDADPCASGVLGATTEEQDALVGVALGEIALSSLANVGSAADSMATDESAISVVPAARTADIVILNESVDKKTTGIATSLRARGYCGVICVLTSASLSTIRRCADHGAIDLVVAKGEALEIIAQRVLAVIANKRHGHPSALLSWDRSVRAKPTPRRTSSEGEKRSTCPTHDSSPPAVVEGASADDGRAATESRGLGEMGGSQVDDGTVQEVAAPLVCMGIDDESLPRMVLEILIQQCLEADPRSRAVGETEEEQLGFVDLVLGRLDPSTMTPLPEGHSPYPHADVAIVDQNINLDLPEPLTGSAIAQRLVEGGFGGVVCVLTGATPDEMAALRAEPSIDLVFAKGERLPEIAAAIKKVHQSKKKRHRKRLDDGGERPTAREIR